MTTCPTCLGEGEFDMTHSDAILAEQLCEQDLAQLRRLGLWPLGVVECEDCAGSGEVTEEFARDLTAAGVAAADQALARLRDQGRLPWTPPS